jgi:hypothetical protein
MVPDYVLTALARSLRPEHAVRTEAYRPAASPSAGADRRWPGRSPRHLRAVPDADGAARPGGRAEERYEPDSSALVMLLARELVDEPDAF